MNGLEYSTLADIYMNKEEQEEKNEIINCITPKQGFKFEQATITSQQKIFQKLQALKECPDYLLPNYFSSSGTGSSFNSTKSSENFSEQAKDSSFPISDDFILLSEFSEIDGPKPLLTIPTDGGAGFNKKEYSLHCNSFLFNDLR
jgi:hypothetical protein